MNRELGPRLSAPAALIGAALLLVPGSASAAPPAATLRVDPADSPLVIRGRLAGQSSAFSGNVRLTLDGANSSDVQLLAPDLQLAGEPDVIIDRTNVSIPGGTSLTAGQPRDVRVTINNLTRPGVYEPRPPQIGLRLLIPGQSDTQAVVVPLKVVIDATPNVKLVGANPSFQLVRCLVPVLDCLLSPILLGGRAVREDATLFLDNQTQVEVENAGPAIVVIRGEKTGAVVGPNALSLSLPAKLPPRQVVPIALTLHPQQLSPDRYVGSILITPSGSADRLTITADLSVRDGPVLPLLAILLGIVVGRVARTMQTPAATMQVRLLPRYYQLFAAAGSVIDVPARAFVVQQLQQIKQRIDNASATDTEQTLGQALDKLSAQSDFLVSLDGLDQQLAAANLDALRANLMPKLDDARHRLINGDETGAQQMRAEVETALTGAQKDGTMGAAISLVAPVLAMFRDSSARLQAAQAAPAATAPPPGFRRAVGRMLAFLSGAQITSAEVRYWLWRPLLFVLLLVLLTALGLQTLYVNAGTTFGAAGLYDYIGLFIWGLSADVAQRTLQNLPVARPA